MRLAKTDIIALLFFTAINILTTLAYIGAGLKFIIVTITTCIFELLLIFALFYAKKRAIPIEKRYLLLAIPLGVAMICVLPCGQAPDDYTHFMRAYGISNGNIVVPTSGDNANGGMLPENAISSFAITSSPGTYARIREKIFEPTATSEEYAGFPASALYNPICYIPQVIGILLAKIFHASIIITAYAARVANYAVFLVLTYFAVKLIPKHKKITIFLLLLPITLQEATSLSPDSITIGLSYFLIAFVLHLSSSKAPLSKKQYIVLYALAVVIGLCKIVYLPLLLLYFIIPSERFGSRRRKIVYAIIIGLCATIVNLCWLSVSSHYLIEIRDGVNASLQLKYVLTHPLHFLYALARSIDYFLLSYLESGLGVVLGPLTIRLPNSYFIFTLVSFIALLLPSISIKHHPQMGHFIVSATYISIIILIFLSLYLQWNPLGNRLIDGVQGRYFLPIAVLLPLAIPAPQTHKKYPALSPVRTQHVLYYALFFNLCALICIFAANI